MPFPRVRGLAMVLVAMSVVACQAAPTAGGAKPQQGPAAPPATKLEAGAILGVLKAPAGFKAMPAGLLGNDGASLIGNDGAGLIGNDGAALIGNDGAAFRLLAAGEAPLAGVEVVLTDAQGRRLANSPVATTNQAGEYLLRGIPAGGTVMVSAGLLNAQGQAAPMQALARTAAEGNRVAIGVASSLVTRALVAEVKGGQLGYLDNARFERATARAEAALTSQSPDLSDAKAVGEWVSRTRSADLELSQLLNEIGASLGNASVEAPFVLPKPSPTPLAVASSPSPTPSPAIAQPSPPAAEAPSPTPAPSLAPAWPATGGVMYVQIKFKLKDPSSLPASEVSLLTDQARNAPTPLWRKASRPDNQHVLLEVAYPTAYFESLSYTLKLGAALSQRFHIKAVEGVEQSFIGSAQSEDGQTPVATLTAGADSLLVVP